MTNERRGSNVRKNIQELRRDAALMLYPFLFFFLLFFFNFTLLEGGMHKQ